DLVINEFLALNSGGLRDVDGDSSDWIELANRGTTAGSLAGFYLTDDHDTLTKWALPSVSLDPGSTLLVFASGKDRRDPTHELHTNFKLDGNGEYLGLVAPDGRTEVSTFAPTFPTQFTNVSYGRSADGGSIGFFRNPSPGVFNNGEPSAS